MDFIIHYSMVFDFGFVLSMLLNVINLLLNVSINTFHMLNELAKRVIKY